MQLVMVARETHLCSWIRLCSPCFILSHIMNILKWFSTELSYGECSAYRGSKCLDVSCVCVFFYFGTQWNSSRYLSIVLENSRVPSSVWVLPSQIWGWVRRGTFTRHSAKLLPISLVLARTELFNSYEVLDSFMTAYLFIVVSSSLSRTKSRQASEPQELRTPPMALDCPSFQELSLGWPGWKPDNNVCIEQWHLCIMIQ